MTQGVMLPAEQYKPYCSGCDLQLVAVIYIRYQEFQRARPVSSGVVLSASVRTQHAVRRPVCFRLLSVW